MKHRLTQSHLTLNGNLLPLSLLLLVGLVVLAPLYLSSGVAPVHSRFHWDTALLHYPRLVFISDSVRYAGEIPCWNPFQDLGFPFIVDPQTMLWSPLTWFVVGTTGYSIDILQSQLIGMFLVAGFGGYFAARALRITRWPAWIAAVSYMFSGYFVTAAGLLGTFSALAYFPWTVGFIALAARQRIPAAAGSIACSAFFLAQCSVGGHPTTATIGAVNLAAMWLLWPRSVHAMLPRVLLLAELAILAALMAMPQLCGVFWLREFFPALDNYTLVEAEYDSLTARGLLGFAFPGIPYFQHLFFENTHVAHLGSYVGVLALVGLPVAFASKLRLPGVRLLLILAVINLLLALGGSAPLRQAVYYFVPLMKAPHHASMDFRGFAILFFVLSAAFGWMRLMAAARAHHGLLRVISRRLCFAAAGLAILGALVLFLAPQEPFATAAASPFIPPQTEKEIGRSMLAEQFFSQALMILVLAALLAIERRRMPHRVTVFLLCLFAAFDMSSAVKRGWTLLAEPHTSPFYEYLEEVENSRAYVFAPDQFMLLHERFHAWEGMVLHHVDLNSYNPPLSLKKREDPPLTVPQLWESYGDLMHKRAMLLDDDGFATTETVHLARLTPNTMQWHVTNPVAGHLRVLSAWTDGWSYRVGDGDWNAVPRRRSDFNTLYVPVPAGEEVAVEFRFEPWWLRQSIGVMIFGYVASLGLAVLGAFSGRFRSRGGRRKLGVSEA